MSCVFDIFFKTESTSDAAKDMNESLSVVPLNSKAKFGQLAHRMEQHIDADAEGSDLRHRFKYGYHNPGLMQAKRRLQPADTAARDQDVHDYEPDSFIRFAIICSMISLEPPPMAPTFMSR